jgi:hypothetical protein
MARNFKVSIQRKNATLHLKLTGDFDGASAFDLLEALRENCRGIESVIIDTTGLKEVYPYGRDIFCNNLRGFLDKSVGLAFTGPNEEKIMAKRSRSV